MKTTIRICLLALAYFITGWLGLKLPAVDSHITLLWLPTGIAVAAMLRWGSGCWPGVALAAFAVNLSTGLPWHVAAGIALGNTLGPLLAAWALRRMRIHPAFDRKRDILLLTIGGAIGMLVSSALGVTTLSVAGQLPEDAVAAWLTWWAGDTMGVITAAPLVLAFTRKEWRSILLHRSEFLGCLAATGLAVWGVFVLNRGMSGGPWALAFVPLPMLAWAALRFGATGTSLALILLSAGAAYGTATGRGPFHRPDPIEGVVVLWIYMATSAVLGWLITAVHFARVRATGIQSLFEGALSDASLGVLLAGPDRLTTYINQGFTRLTGYTEADMMGKNCSILQGPKTDPVTVERLREALRGGGHFEGEILNYRKDGTPFWNALVISPVLDEQGVMTGFLGIQRDITRRKETEMALHQSEEYLRTMVDLAPECVKLVSPDGKLLEMNPAGLAMIEAESLDQVRGGPLMDIVVPEDRAAFLATHERVLRGEVGHCEFSITGLKGARRTLETHAVPYRNARQEIIGVLGMTRDITQKKKAAAELQSAFSTLQLFVNSVPAYISFVDAEERYQLVNRNYEEYFGRPSAQIVGQRLRDLQSPAAYAEMEPHVRKALTGEPVHYQANPTGLDGRSRWFDVQYVPRRGSEGEVTGFFVLVFDITEKKQAEIALSDSRSRLDSILNSMDDVVWSSTPDGHALLFVSASAQALYGFPASEFMADPMKWLAVIHPEDKGAAERASHEVTELGECDAEYRIIRADGAVRWVHDRGRIVKDEHGQPLRLDGIVTDITERRTAQEALRRSEEQLRSLTHNMPDVVARYDQDRRHLYINPAAEYATGIKPEAFIGRTNEELGMPAENTAGWKAVLDRVFSNGSDERHEFSYPGPTGKNFWESLVVAERGAAGNVETALVISRDITERKRLEQEREQYLKFFRLSTEPMCIADPFGCFMQVNPAFIQLTGFSEGELLEKPYLDFILHEDREKTTEEMKLQVASRPSMQFENRYVCKDGAILLLSWTAIFDKNDGVTYATARDITKIRRGELALRDSEGRYRTLFEANPHPMWAYDLETLRFLAVNASAISHYGYSREEFLAMTIKDIRPPEDIPALMENIGAVGEGLDYAGVWWHRKRDGSLIEVEITSHVMEFGGRQAEVVLAHDVTEQRRAKTERERLARKMQETQKLESLGVLAGGIAHDFNNILTAILGNASLAIDDVSPGSPVHECLDQISGAALRAADLCKQMLAYSGRGRFVVRRLDLGQLIAETIQMLQISISKKAMLHFQPAAGLPPVEVDPTQMRQVIMNLVINASDAIGEKGGIITVSTGRVQVDEAYVKTTKMPAELPVGDYVFVEVSDSGCGMSAEIQAKIFDPFFTTKFTGRGLGLAAVLGIVRGHKGAMKVYSEPSRGTTFKLLFPAAVGPTEAAPQSPAASTGWRGHGTVLVVDDEQAVRTTVAPMLTAMGLEFSLAHDGREGVEIFGTDPGKFSLVLLDLTMPRMDGAEAFAELRKMRPGVPVVLMSGFNEQEALVRFAGKGIASFIQKPFTFDALRTVIRSVVG